MSYYYLYIIEFETGQFYIGSRKSKVPAVKDTDYWGSPGKINESLWELKKEKHILFESTDISYKELTNKEKVFIGEAWKKFGKEKCINKNIGGNIDPKVISKRAKENYKNGIGGLANLTPEMRKSNQLKAAKTKSVEFQVRDPKGKIHTAKGIYPFAKKHGLHGGNFWQLIRGNADSCQGWTKFNVDLSTIITKEEKFLKMRDEGTGMWSKESKEKAKQSIIKKTAREYHVISPDGKEYKGKNARAFMREHGLSGAFMQLLQKKRDRHKGWTRVDNT